MSSWFTSLGDSLSSSGILGPLVLGASVLGATYLTTKANTAAADKVAAASAQAAQVTQAATDRANDRADALLQAGAPGISRLSQIMREDPSRLSTSQQSRVDDMRRGQENFLAVTGLKGAGRAAVEAVRAREDATVNSFMDANRAKQDAATSQLSNIAVGASGSMSQNDLSQASTLANLGTNAASTQAQAGIANADQYGSALGAIGSLIAGDNKRNSRYSDNVSGG